MQTEFMHRVQAVNMRIIVCFIYCINTLSLYYCFSMDYSPKRLVILQDTGLFQGEVYRVRYRSD